MGGERASPPRGASCTSGDDAGRPESRGRRARRARLAARARWRSASPAWPTSSSCSARRPARRPFPVEYKRGKPKAHRADEVQLCAQALCLEEMIGVPVPEGALFYGETTAAPAGALRRRPARADRRDGRRRPRHDRRRAHAAAAAHPPPAAAARSPRCANRSGSASRRASRAGWRRSLRLKARRCAACSTPSTSPARAPGCARTAKISWSRSTAPSAAARRCTCSAASCVFGRAGASPALLAACAEAASPSRTSPRTAVFWRASRGRAPATCSCAARSTASPTIRRAKP